MHGLLTRPSGVNTHSDKHKKQEDPINDLARTENPTSCANHLPKLLKQMNMGRLEREGAARKNPISLFTLQWHTKEIRNL